MKWAVLALKLCTLYFFPIVLTVCLKHNDRYRKLNVCSLHQQAWSFCIGRHLALSILIVVMDGLQKKKKKNYTHINTHNISFGIFLFLTVDAATDLIISFKSETYKTEIKQSKTTSFQFECTKSLTSACMSQTSDTFLNNL